MRLQQTGRCSVRGSGVSSETADSTDGTIDRKELIDISPTARLTRLYLNLTLTVIDISPPLIVVTEHLMSDCISRHCRADVASTLVCGRSDFLFFRH